MKRLGIAGVGLLVASLALACDRSDASSPTATVFSECDRNEYRSDGSSPDRQSLSYHLGTYGGRSLVSAPGRQYTTCRALMGYRAKEVESRSTLPNSTSLFVRCTGKSTAEVSARLETNAALEVGGSLTMSIAYVWDAVPSDFLNITTISLLPGAQGSSYRQEAYFFDCEAEGDLLG